jgi:PAS domain S-box-containing protein
MRDVSRRVTRTTIAVAIVLLVTTAFLVVTLSSQNKTLGDNAVVTRDIVNANARTIGQVQREILRLSTVISGGETDPEVVDLHRSFVGQRIDESTLDSQLQTLGSADLLQQTNELDRVWHSSVQPLVVEIVDDPTGVTDAQRDQVLTALADLERAFNSISTDAEQNRKDQATQSNDATLRSLDASRMVIGAMVVMLVGFGVFFAVSLVAFRRTARSQQATTRRLAEVNAEMRKLSYVASATDNAVVITDAEGFTEWVNDAFTRVTGYTFDEVKGLRPGWVLQGPGTDRATVDALRASLQAGSSHNCELLNYRKDGSEYWVEIEVQPVRDADGVLTHFIAVESDITGRREAEDQLIRAKNAAESLANEKASFLASMSHEIRTPLNSVIGLTGLLLDTDLTDDQREFAETARNSGTMLLSIVNNILNFSALEAGNIDSEPVHFVLSEMLDRSVGLLARQARLKGLEIAVETDPELPRVVIGDETRLQQVLVNLVANAVKFTESGGITVSAELLPDAAETNDETGGAGVSEGTVGVRIRVADTGIGIPSDRLHRLFKPFSQVDASTTRRYGGTGLGLAISHHIVSLLGGEIDVVSVPGEGTTFEVVLRLQPGADASVADDSTGSRVVPSSLRILVAEDDKVNQLVLGKMLDRLGYTATIVGDGLAAIEALGRARYDVVLMDVQMPRLDGIGATQRIRAQLPTTEQPLIVAVTASALEGDREKLLATGMDLYLSKPIQLQALSSTLTEVSRRTTVPFDGSVRPGTTDEPIDMVAFRQATGTNDETLLLQLVGTFADSAYELMDGMLRALADNDPFTMQVVAHQMKDRAASACATGLADLAGRVQAMAQPGQVGETAALLARIGDEIERVRTWHRDHVAEHRSVTAVVVR